MSECTCITCDAIPLTRHSAMRKNEKKLARRARIQARRANVSPSTLGLLSDDQTVFFEATNTNTIFTDAIEAGDTDDALLIRLLYKPDATTLDTYYIWVDEEDQAEDIAQAWSAIPRGAAVAKEDPTEFAPWFKCGNKELQWAVKLGLETGYTIEHRV
jgi:hypothetical protein